MTEIALSESNLPPSQEGYLKKIEYSAKYLLTLINDILDMSRIESGKTHVEITDANLSDITKGLQSIIGTQCDAKGVRFTVEDRFPARKFKTDILKLNQILLNLLGNAVKFTPAGGEIKLEVALAAENNIEFTVTDTGIGIRKERLQKIFEPFEQADDSTIRQYGGTGLGLPISSSYIALLGGQMEISSEPDKGTTFRFTIPVVIPEEPAPDTAAASTAIADLTGRRILIAEDDELNMEIARTLLEKSGFIVEGAVNGRETVEKFAASKPGYYDAILMDIRMPIMDGLAAAAAIRSSGKGNAADIPIIALSANAFAEDIKTSKDAGMNDHIIKPLDMRILLAKLSEYIK
jgi:CheY-like chemotaxis protein